MKRFHASFRFGLIGGVILVLLYLLTSLLSTSVAIQWIMVVVEGLFYIGFANSATEAQYRFQVENVEEPLAGVQSEGMGAALIICVIGWVFRIVRWLILSANGTVLVEPLSLACNMGVSGLLAMGLGAWSANRVVKKYQFMKDDNWS